MKCDVFISYRRDGGDMTAMYIYQALKERGYDVFYDLEVLRAGKFNDALLENIHSCKDFLLILSPHALDRCTDENDWVRREIAEALRCKKNIIPVMLNGFVFPENLPEDIQEVRYQNGLTATTEYFMESVNRLCTRYLDSKPKKKRVNAALIISICIAVAALACAAVMGLQLLEKQEPVSNSQIAASMETEALPSEEPTMVPAAEPTAISVLSGTDLPRLRSDFLSGTYTDNWSERPVFGNEELARWEISSVTFVPTLEGMGQDAWDVSEDGNGSVMAWVKRNGSLYDLFIGAQGGVAISDGFELFMNYENMNAVSFNGCVDLSYCSSTRAMFEFCVSLESIDLSGLDTSNVLDMAALFHGCRNLKHIDLSMLNTSNVQDMHMMFAECNGLESINLSGMDTSQVEDMSEMFRGCWSLKELDVSGFETIRVRNMAHMFEGCESLTLLDLSSWNTSHVGIMNGMFLNCVALTDLNLSGWDTRSVTEMNSMFMNCRNLPALNVSSFDTSAVNNMLNIFMNCSSLTELDLTAWKTANVTNMESMFDCCSSLHTLNLPDGFVGSSVLITVHMFCHCENLNHINTNGWDTANVFDMVGMFEGCCALKELDVSGWNTASVENMGYMFSNCALEQLYIEGWDVSKVRNYECMFENCANLNMLRLPENFVHENMENTRALFNNCQNLAAIDAGGWNTSSVIDMWCMFNECQSLKELDVSGWDVSAVTDMGWMFAGCEQLQSLDISAWDLNNVGNKEGMFDRCAYQPDI